MSLPYHVSSSANSLRADYIQIPDLLAGWSWPRRINPLYHDVVHESRAWLHSQHLLNAKSQAAFDKCELELFASLFSPESSHDHLRTCIEVQYLSFMIDEYSDVKSALVVREMADVCKDVFRHPVKRRPDGEVFIGELTRQIWTRMLETASPQAARHFMEAYMTWLDALVLEVEIRDSDTPLTIDQYWAIRLEDIGVRPLCALGELSSPLPDDVISHPVILDLTYAECELIAIDNDIVSYNREQATGAESFNIVTIVMWQFNLDRDGAVQLLRERVEELEAQYRSLDEHARALAPSFGPHVHQILLRYLEHMGNLRRAAWCWSFECGRYFGGRGSEFTMQEKMPLVSKKSKLGSLREQVEVMDMEVELALL